MVLLLVAFVISLFIGVIELPLQELLSGNLHLWEIFLVSRLPRLLAILCTGVGMSVAGLIMQQLCSNKFVSPTTGATISSAQFGILLALLFMPASTLWSRAIFAVVYFVDPGALCLCGSDPGHLDLRLVHPAHPV